MTLPLPLLHSVQASAGTDPGTAPGKSAVATFVLNVSSIEQAQQLASEQLAGRGFIQYWPVLAELCGVKPALMLGHAVYWTRGWLRQHPERGGWFWKTAKEWQEATGLTAREQESARSILRELGFWQEELATTPGQGNRLFYRLNIAELCKRLIATAKERSEGTNTRWDTNFLLALLGQPISYYRALADLSGGVIGGLVLSHLLSELRIAVMRKLIDADGFFPFSVEEQRRALSLGTKSQRNARESLKNAGFVLEALTKGQRPTLLVSVNLAAILALLTGKGAPGVNTPAGRAARRVQDRPKVVGEQCNVTTISGPVLVIENAVAEAAGLVEEPSQDEPHLGAFRQSRAAFLSKRRRISAVEGCPFVDSRAALLSALYTKPSFQINSSSARERLSKRRLVNPDEGGWRSLSLPFDTPTGRRQSELTSSTSVPEKLEPSQVVQKRAEDQLSLDALVWPDGIDAEKARKVLSKAPATINLQELIDELAGQMRAKPIPSPVGYLSTLLRKAVEGSFVPTRAAGVAETRSAHARLETALSMAKTSAVRCANEVQAVADRTPLSVNAKRRLMDVRRSLATQMANSAFGFTSGDAIEGTDS